ncbi:MAG: DUF333 domain-containing protein [Brevundimonas sp.]|uniref:putative hemolysin n=1 Tax=Brevundimonas sp. TaxID=1871086 RepID=UPI0028D39EA8|nr:DUF333 domain-containing protein [uncultured Brevundimonas sp.]
MKPLLLTALPLLALSACADGPSQPRMIGMANPASKYCLDIGGRLETTTAADGGQSSLCHLPDGRVMEEWALFRSAHPARS